jgi:hypothetical protein
VAERAPGQALSAFAGVTLVAGIGLMALLDSGWAHAVGVLCLFAGGVSAFALSAGSRLAE